jgi:hypothetical protein
VFKSDGAGRASRQADKDQTAKNLAFMRDLKAFFREKDPHKRDLIVGDQMRALGEHQRPGDKRINIVGLKELFYAMKDQD